MNGLRAHVYCRTRAAFEFVYQMNKSLGTHHRFQTGVYDGRSMSCEEKTRLTARYEAATTRFCEAVTELNQKMGTSAKTEYDHLARVANELRLKSEQARLALEQHLAVHLC